MKTEIKRWALVSFFLLGMVVVSISCHKAVNDKKVIIGGKNFTEQYLLAEMGKNLMEKNGFSVELKTGVGSSVIRQSLLKGQIDLYYEYTGTAYTVYHKQADPHIMTDRTRCYEWVKEADAREGLIWLESVPFNNSYTLMMREEDAERLGISSISDLSRYINKYPEKLLIGVNAEFWERPDGFKALMSHYGFMVPYNSIKKMESGLAYKALQEEHVSVSMGFETDGRIGAFGFINLKDDRSFFPVYNPAPVIRKNVLDKYPEIQKILEPIAEHLTTEEMRKLNAEVDIEKKQVEDVAANWLKRKNLL
jgi:osmoprotectant transport system substrate-binding protein